MLDIKFIRENKDLVSQTVKNKNGSVSIDRILELDTIIRDLNQKIELLRHNQKSYTQDSIDEARKNKEALKSVMEQLEKPLKEFNALILLVPNIPSDDTPVGPDELSNKILRQVGEKRHFDFKPKEHWELGKKLDVIDVERASQVAGSRFAYIKGDLVLLEFALIQFALKVLSDKESLQDIARKAKLNVSDKPFTPVVPPVFIRPDVLQKMGRLEPKEERYYIQSDDLYLAGSAEHTLGSMHMGEIIPADKLPIRYVGFSTSFRREAGSYGKDTKGILRVHQFDKLEMESFTKPEDSQAEQDFCVALQEYLMVQLNLPYQVVICSTGDQGDPDNRHIDIEAWLPGQDKYRETHSSDLMTDFQARRLQTKFRKEDGKTEFVHTHDATVFAIGRTLIAIMENYQQATGSITIPEVLIPYCGKKEIKYADNN